MTAQVPDKIIYQGESLGLLSNPLEDYQGPSKERLRFQPRNTANWRGYVATWEIDEDNLYLIEIDAKLSDGTSAKIENLFIEAAEDGRIKATWFTGVLRIAKGELLNYVHMGYASTYARELFVTIEGSKVTNTTLVEHTTDNPPTFLDRQTE